MATATFGPFDEVVEIQTRNVFQTFARYNGDAMDIKSKELWRIITGRRGQAPHCVRNGCRPVNSPYRETWHNGPAAWASVNRMPAAASESMCGVEILEAGL